MAKDNFFSKDKRIYDIKHNREFLSWYRSKIKSGYSPLLTVEEIDRLIDYISMWYFFKLPNRKYLKDAGEKDLAFANIRDISIDMGFNELLYRLPKNNLELLNGIYRSKYSGSIPIKNKEGEIIQYKPIIGIEITKDKMSDGTGLSSIILEADAINGYVDNNELKKNFPSIGTGYIDLGNLYNKLKEEGNYNLDHLNRIINNHNIDLELRDRIIFYISLKMMYNISSTPEYNYQRAQTFNKELKDYLNVDIDISYLDDLIKEKEKGLRRR